MAKLKGLLLMSRQSEPILNVFLKQRYISAYVYKLRLFTENNSKTIASRLLYSIPSTSDSSERDVWCFPPHDTPSLPGKGRPQPLNLTHGLAVPPTQCLHGQREEEYPRPPTSHIISGEGVTRGDSYSIQTGSKG